MSELTALVRDAVAETRRALLPAVEADWSVPAHELEWSCWDTGLHIADDLLFYAMQVIDQTPGGYVPVELRMWDGAQPEGMLRSILTCGEILAIVSASAPPDARGHHTYGVSDPEGFAAMGVLETVVHTYDIALGLGWGWGWTGRRRRPCAGRCSTGCSRTRRPATRPRCCCGAPAEHRSATDPASRTGAGTAAPRPSADGRAARGDGPARRRPPHHGSGCSDAG